MNLPSPIERIMLVDDNEADNVFHEIVIQRCGFTGDLRSFDDPARALQYLRELPHGPVSLVLLDINMPGLTGWDFAEAARPLLLANPTIVLVMLSSSSLAEDRAQAAAQPVIRGYLTKPLTREAVQEMLQGRWPATRAD